MHRIAVSLACVVAALLAVARPGASGPPLFTDALPAEEFATRRDRLLDRLGDGVAVLQGAAESPGYSRFRQGNQFFYLTGVEVPRAIAVIDGRSRTTTLFLPPRDERLERSEGPVLVPGDEAARLTGIPAVRPRDEFARAAEAFAGRTLHVPHRADTLGAGAYDRTAHHATKTMGDRWDGRQTREAVFLDLLKQSAARIEVRNLDPLLDEMRMIKSPREIELIRKATRIAGDAIIEVMRSARVGMYEYELAAIGDYFFRRHNSQGPAYYALVAAGQNAYYPHYHASQSVLADGDLVLFDYAPDYMYYTSDVTREFPASGRFSPDQRELYGTYVRLYNALMRAIRPHAAPRAIMREAVTEMDAILAGTRFSSATNASAARTFVDQFRYDTGNSLGHFVGMEVHDVFTPYERLAPGMVFTIEPALTIPGDRLYIRLEDPILITETGYENLSAFVPMEIDEIERLMAEPGRFEPAGPAPTTSSSRP